LEINYSDTHRDLVERSKKGQQKAQYQLYKLYSKAMFNICIRMMNNKEDAEDTLQEAFSEAFQKLDPFRYESSFGAWLKRIVVNRCINNLKKKQADLLYVDNLHKLDRNEETDETNEEEIQYSVSKIMNALSKLADGYRVIFSLYLLEGYDHTEISCILGISESTSKSQFLRAKKKLIEIMQQN